MTEDERAALKWLEQMGRIEMRDCAKHAGTILKALRALRMIPAPESKTVWRVTRDDGCAGGSRDFETEAEAMAEVQQHLRDEEIWVTIQRREVPA